MIYTTLKLEELTMNETINYRIQEFDKILTEKGEITQNINRTLFMAYDDSIENKNALINFDRTIWSKDVAPIVDTFRGNGINEFSISNTASGLTNILEAFESLGCKVCGLIKANLAYGRKTVPAVKLQVL